MSDFSFTDQELSELKDAFFAEAYEILHVLNEETLNLEEGHDRSGSLTSIQRSLHTLKGNARALGYSSLNLLSHRAEDLLRMIQENSLDMTPELVDLLFSVHDALKRYLDGYRANSEVSFDEKLTGRIEEYLKTSENGREGKESASSPSGVHTLPRTYEIFLTFDPRCTMKTAGVVMLRDRLSMLGTVVGIEPSMESGLLESSERCMIRFSSADASPPDRELLMISGVVKNVDIREDAGGMPEERLRGHKGPSGPGETIPTLRVDSQRVDKILNLVGELVIGRSMINQVLVELLERYRKDELVKRLGEANAFMEKTLSLLQKNVMKIRMLPIAQIFRKFPRVVRDLSREKGKEVRLEIRGEKTDLDKSILDALGEPLLHLVRNAVDHGIEPADEREKKGKSRGGIITLSACHEGNQIVITVMDDGAGIDPDRLRKKAVEHGVRTSADAARLSDAEALNLIFLPGFSTAERVTDISGRGLGMDIVRTIVESLKGRINVQSEPGAGTTFTLKLPLTLAIIRAMLFSVDGRLFAFPMTSVEKIIRMKDANVQTVSGRTVLRFRDRVVGLFPLRDLLTFPGDGPVLAAQKSVIVVAHGGAFSAFIVDRILGQQELVIKVLENYWDTIKYTAGASILGNGKVVLILDVPALVASEKAGVDGPVPEVHSEGRQRAGEKV
jgi:two-component system chemotaxis sensor kinase CheA